MSQGKRRLAAIMFTDMAGYTALGQRNEALSLALAEKQRKLLRPVFSRHNGREIKTMGDAFLVEFSNALDAVRSAYDVQRASREFNVSRPGDQRIILRIGLHLGDVVETKGDISGDAVNIASRIQSLAENGGICITRQVYDQVQNKFELPFKSLGTQSLKNVSAPLEVYKMILPWDKQQSSETVQLDTRRVAVLPFANMSPDPSDSYFADGVTEEIISTLSGVSGLSVISRTSIMGYKGTTKKVKDIGSELEAGSVLEGSFRKAGNKIRVTAQLVNVKDDRHVWTNSYDRNLDDVFGVQTDIAKQVSDALRVKILAPEIDRIDRKPTENTNAYNLYLRGRYHLNRRGIEDINKAAEYFVQAIKEDAKFALGHAGLADCHELLAANWGIDTKANHERAKREVAAALKLDGDLAEAHTTRGLLLHHEYDFKSAEHEFKKAIELKPSYATAHQWYFHVLGLESRWDEALKQIEKAVELDPFSQVINMNHAHYYFLTKDYDKALDLLKRAVELDPNSVTARLELMTIYAKVKRFDDAKRERNIGVELLKGAYPQVAKRTDAFLAYVEDNKEAIRRLLPELEANLGEPLATSAAEIAGYHFYLGEIDPAFEWLEKSYSRKEVELLGILFDEQYDNVRNDPRYQSVLKRLGLEQPSHALSST
ncbi:MAG TPA: adenylate/guanylate cyclase domain-containing protein [Candidatus Bathyarchaeia archaeon]|nr:adenylate/guanylate cyclase domain-containing protein [Candidatus Bathyarchaeia archaeon]